MNKNLSILHKKERLHFIFLWILVYSLICIWPSECPLTGTLTASAQTTEKSYIIITNKVKELELNSTKTFKVKSVNLDHTKYSWSSSNTKIAKVSKTGTVTALSAGKVTIKVKDRISGKTSACTLRVRPAATDASEFSYKIQNKKVTITDYHPSKKITKLVVPSKIEGYPVTKIGVNAFYRATSIKTVDLPYGITTLDKYAFYGCKALTKITIPSTLKVFNEGAFASCTALNHVSLPSKVITLGNYLFNNCKSLTAINLPDTCKTLGTDLLSATPLSSLTNLQLYVRTGSDLFLTDEDQKVYEKLISVLDTLDLETNPAVEQIKKVHDWMIMNCTYDTRVFQGTMPEESYLAYGFLFNHTAVCSGYAETFQLFMYLLGIDCNYITGTGNGDYHAWNSVKIDDDWYQIDVTWDDPLPETNSLIYNYFLLTDDTMNENHSWNHSLYPAANGTAYRYYAYKDFLCQDADSIRECIQAQIKDGSEWITVLCPESIKIQTYLFEFASSYTLRTPYKCGEYKVYVFQLK